jgi:hypothetical protein
MMKSLFAWFKSIQLRQIVIGCLAVILVATTAEQGYENREVNKPALFDVERSASVDETRSAPPNEGRFPYTDREVGGKDLVETARQNLRGNNADSDDLIDNAQQKLKSAAENIRDRFSSDQAYDSNPGDRLSDVPNQAGNAVKGAQRTFKEGTKKAVRENEVTRNRNAEPDHRAN